MTQGQDNYWTRTIRRRAVLRGGLVGTLGVSAYALVGCGDDDDDDASGTPGATNTGAAATPTVATIPTGGTLTTLQASDPTSIDPHFGQGGGDHQFFWMIHDNLVNYNQAGELDKSISLAENWEQADPTTINMTLRSGVKFHDGTPFNAAAVKFNIERAQSDKSAAKSQMLAITKVEAIDDTHVRLTLNKPNAAILTLLGDRGGAIVSPAAVDKYGDQFGRNPVGTGKFVFKEWAQSDHITVTKNPSYWGKDAAGTQLPYLDEIRINIVPDSTVALANLEAGTVDLVGLSAGDVDRFAKNDKFQVQQSATGSGWSGTYANQALKPIDDVKLRRAIARALDRKAILQAVQFGLGAPGIGPIAVGTWAYNDKLKGLDFDLAEAKKELAASGYPDGTKIEMITINTSFYQQHAELWKEMLSKINIDLTVVPVAVAELTNRTFVLKNAPMQLAGFSLRADPDGTISETLRSDGFYNPGHLPNAELDGLIDKARETYVQAERKTYYDQIQQIAIDQVYDWYVFYSYLNSAAQKNILNLSQLYGGEAKPRYANLAKKA
ncbi:MAG: ABC transporter substrate-binding protein [Dehalococcoidia bacterium]